MFGEALSSTQFNTKQQALETDGVFSFSWKGNHPAQRNYGNSRVLMVTQAPRLSQESMMETRSYKAEAYIHQNRGSRSCLGEP